MPLSGESSACVLVYLACEDETGCAVQNVMSA